jgi:hypothetical protein
MDSNHLVPQKVLGAPYVGFRSHRRFRSGNSLTQLGQRAVPAARRVARIPQHAGRRRARSEVGGRQPVATAPAVAAHRAARKINLNRALATGWKAKTCL